MKRMYKDSQGFILHPKYIYLEAIKNLAYENGPLLLENFKIDSKIFVEVKYFN